MMSPRLAKLARTPAVVGWVITLMNPQRASRRSSIAHTVLGSCMRERIPSCIRAPPDAVTATSGTFRSTAESAARVSFSPTTLPIEPPMKREVHDRELARFALDRGAPDHHRVPEAGRDLGFGEPLGVRAQVEEGERVFGPQVDGLLLEGPGVDELRDPLACSHRKVVAALRADTKARLELVVAVVRPARRARVRVLSSSVRVVGEMLVLDRDVYAWLGQDPSIIAQASRTPGSFARRACRPARRHELRPSGSRRRLRARPP